MKVTWRVPAKTEGLCSVNRQPLSHAISHTDFSTHPGCLSCLFCSLVARTYDASQFVWLTPNSSCLFNTPLNTPVHAKSPLAEAPCLLQWHASSCTCCSQPSTQFGIGRQSRNKLFLDPSMQAMSLHHNKRTEVRLVVSLLQSDTGKHIDFTRVSQQASACASFFCKCSAVGFASSSSATSPP